MGNLVEILRTSGIVGYSSDVERNGVIHRSVKKCLETEPVLTYFQMAVAVEEVLGISFYEAYILSSVNPPLRKSKELKHKSLQDAVTIAIKRDYPGYEITQNYDHENVRPGKDGLRRSIMQCSLYYLDEERFLRYVKEELVEIKEVLRTKKEIHCLVSPKKGLFG